MTNYPKIIRSLTIVLFLCATLLRINAADPINSSFWGNKAIDGYDPVAYHLQKRAVLGAKKISYPWKGAVWFFSSSENRDLFKKDPQKYAPQYGGYCAWAAAQGKLADTDPKLFDLHEGKLYLNYNRKTQSDWRLDKKNMIFKGDKLY